MSGVSQQVVSTIGYLLSKYEQTAADGLEKIVTLSFKPQTIEKNIEDAAASHFADVFVSESQAVGALLSIFDDQKKTSSGDKDKHKPRNQHTNSNMALGFRACLSLLNGCIAPASRLAFARNLCTPQFVAMLRRTLSALRENEMEETMGALSLLTAIVEGFPALIMGKLRLNAFLDLGVFNSLNARNSGLRLMRCKCITAWALTPNHDANRRNILTHGYLTALTEDVAELLAPSKVFGSDPTLNYDVSTLRDVISRSLQIMQEGFLGPASGLSITQKREILMGQRNVIRALAQWLTPLPGIVSAIDGPDAKTSVVTTVSNVLRSLVMQLREETSDYLLSRQLASVVADGAQDAGLNYMPNFTLFSLLRVLKPKSSVEHAKLLVFILQQSPDLIRPFYTRCVQHIFEKDRQLATGTHYAAVINIMTRASGCGIPYHISDPTVPTICWDAADTGSATVGGVSAASALSFYCLTPSAVVDEVCPSGFSVFVHQILKSNENVLYLLMAIQGTQAVLQRAQRVLHALRNTVSAALEAHRQEHGTNTAVTPLVADTFIAATEALLRERLPSLEEFWHRVSKQLLPAASEKKVEFVLQRLYLLVHSYVDVFSLRSPWSSAVPHPCVAAAPEAPVGTKRDRQDDGAVIHISALIGGEMDSEKWNDSLATTWEGKTVSSLCALLLSNLVRSVPLPKLHHITMNNGANSKLTEMSKNWPPLLSILLWYEANRNQADDEHRAEALGWITNLVLWVVHNSTIRFACSVEEVHLWLTHIPRSLLPTFLQLINTMLQQSLSKVADRVAEGMTEATTGVLHQAAEGFIARHREKIIQKQEAGKKPAAVTCPWQHDLNEHIGQLEQFLSKIQKKWGTRHDSYARFRSLACPVDLSPVGAEGSVTEAVKIDTANSSQLLYPVSAHLVQLLLVLGGQSNPAALNGGSVPSVVPAVAETTDSDTARRLLSACETDVQRAILGQALVDPVAFLNAPIDASAAGVLLDAIRCVVSDANLLLSLFNGPSAVAYILGAVCLKCAPVASTTAVSECSSAIVSQLAALEQEGRGITGVQSTAVLTGSALLVSAAALGAHLTHAKLKRTALENACDFCAKQLYFGTLSCADRLVFSAITTLENMASPSTAEADEDSSDSESDGDPVAADDAAPVKKNRRRGKQSSFTAASLLGSPCQRTFRRVRFAVARRTTLASAACVEAAMLALCTEGVPDAEVFKSAMTMPLTLVSRVNRILNAATLPSSASKRTPQPLPIVLLRLAYSDVASREEHILAGNLSAPVATTVPIHGAIAAPALLPYHTVSQDPRYLLPLLAAVGAVRTAHPDVVPSHILTRCLPVVVRALSSSDVPLRLFAASAFSHVSNCCGGMPKLVLNYLKIAVAPGPHQPIVKSSGKAEEEEVEGNQTAVLLAPKRAPASLTAFALYSLFPLQKYTHKMHNHFANCFVTAHGADAPEIFTNPCPIAFVLAEFPLSCVTHERLIANQEALKKSNSMGTTAAESQAVSKITKAVERAVPPHLTTVMSLLCCSVSSRTDAINALARTNAMTNLYLLASMLHGAPLLRLDVVRCIATVVTSSLDSARACVSHPSLRVIDWALQFMAQLNGEFGTSILSARTTTAMMAGSKSAALLSKEGHLRTEAMLLVARMLERLVLSDSLPRVASSFAVHYELQMYASSLRSILTNNQTGSKLITETLTRIETGIVTKAGVTQ